MDVLGIVSNITWLTALCLLVGLILVIVEMHVPGFGAPGITGGILLIVGILLTAKNFLDAFILILVVLVVLGLALLAVLQSATKGKLNKNLVLSHSLDKASGYIGTEDLEYFLGKEGKTITTLRPAGISDFDGVRLDVVSNGEFIQKDTPVRIVSVQGRRIVVKAIEE